MDPLNISYEEFYGRARPFDLLAFRGVDPISRSILFLERKELGDGGFSHLGMVVTKQVLPYISCLREGELYVLESTASATQGVLAKFAGGPPDLLTGKGKIGVQIRNLREVIASYLEGQGAAVAWCPLIRNPWDDWNRRSALVKTMHQWTRHHDNAVYEVDPFELLAAIFPCCLSWADGFDRVIVLGTEIIRLRDECHELRRLENGRDFMYCSELVAEVYRRIGVLPNDTDPRTFAPVAALTASPAIVRAPVYLTSQ